LSNENEQGGQLAVQDGKRELAKPKARLEADGGAVAAVHPRTLEEALRYGHGLAASGIVPDSFRFDGKKVNDVNVSLVAMGVLKALEIGLPAQTGLAFLLPINGRFTVWGDGAWALVQRSGQLATHTVVWQWPVTEMVDGEPVTKLQYGGSLGWADKHVTPLDKWPNEIGVVVSMWRVGQADPYVGEYTVGRAKRAGLWNNSYKKPWQLDPERMLFNRSRAYPMRDGFADALFGLSIAEEVRDYAPDPKPQLVDNSALDDELPSAPVLTDQRMAEGGDLESRAEAYKAGLALQGTLEALVEYQSMPDHVALIANLQRMDENGYQLVIAANARRYQEIEQAERARERERGERAIEAERAADAERGQQDGAPPEDGEAAAKPSDLFGSKDDE
jgi:hypothetical protein